MPKERKNVDRRRKPVLILECDSDTLASQNLAVGVELSAWLEVFFPRNPLHLLQSRTRADLLKEFAALKQSGQSFGNVVVIGHSNRSGLKINADDFITWEAVGGWLELFDPRRLFLLACEAGQWLPCAALFKKLPKLDEIVGSPVPANKEQQYFILASVLHQLDAKQADSELIKMLQIGNFLLNKGVMFRQTRTTYERGGREQGEIWTHIAEPLIDQILKKLR